MKTHLRNLIALFGLVCSSCVPSIHPIYSNAEVAFDSGLIGTWEEKGSEGKWEFTTDVEKKYKVVHTDDRGKKGEFAATPFKLGGQLFLDLYPTAPVLTQNDFYRGHILSLHSFAKLTPEGNAYQVSFLEPEWLKTHLAKDPAALRYTMVDGQLLITDSTANLQKFIVSNAAVPEAFAAIAVYKKGEKR